MSKAATSAYYQIGIVPVGSIYLTDYVVRDGRIVATRGE